MTRVTGHPTRLQSQRASLALLTKVFRWACDRKLVACGLQQRNSLLYIPVFYDNHGQRLSTSFVNATVLDKGKVKLFYNVDPIHRLIEDRELELYGYRPEDIFKIEIQHDNEMFFAEPNTRCQSLGHHKKNAGALRAGDWSVRYQGPEEGVKSKQSLMQLLLNNASLWKPEVASYAGRDEQLLKRQGITLFHAHTHYISSWVF